MAAIMSDEQIAFVLLIAGLREERWLTDEDVEGLAVHVGAIRDGVYHPGVATALAIECIRVAKARGPDPARQGVMAQRIIELQRTLAAVAAVSSDVAAQVEMNTQAIAALGAFDAEALARLGLRVDANETAIDAEETERARADGALGDRIDAEAKARADADNALGGRISRITGSIAISPSNIPDAASVVRDYVFAWEDLDENWLKAQGVNQMDIWMKNTGFHALDPWNPTQDGMAAVNVNANEARAIGIGNDTVVPVRAVFRRDGQFVALVNTWLTIGGGGGDVTTDQFQAEQKARAAGDDFNKTIIAGEDAATANAALAAFLAAQASSANVGIIEVTANAAQADGHAYVLGDIVVFAPGGSAGKIVGNIARYAHSGFGFLSTQVNSEAQLNALADGQRDDRHGEFVEVTAGFRYSPQGVDYIARDILWLQPFMPSRLGVKKLFNLGGEAKPFALTQAQQIGLLQFSPRPGNVIAENGKAQAAIDVQYNIRIANAELLTGDIWVQGTIQGQPALARTKWSNAIALNLNIPDANVASVVASVQLSNTVELVLQFYDAAMDGNLVEQLWWNIPFTELPAAGGVKPNVLLAYTRAGMSAPVQLPANFADYSALEILYSESSDGNNMQAGRFPTLWFTDAAVGASGGDSRAFQVGVNPGNGRPRNGLYYPVGRFSPPIPARAITQNTSIKYLALV